MEESQEPFEALKQILRHVRDPQTLDDHPWTRSLIVQEMVLTEPERAQAGFGQQLIDALARLFPQLKPAAPPRRGKRLDPRWGEFGLLAALYFVPFNHGTAYPTSFMDAWGCIDPAILYFAYTKPVEELSDEEIERYQLVGADLMYAPASTLSDWHRKGIQRFTEILMDRERFLSRSHARPSVILEPEQARVDGRSCQTHRWRWLRLALILAFILALSAASFKGWRIYQSGMQVYQDVRELRQQAQPPFEIEKLETVIPSLTTLQGDLSELKQEVRPVLWFSPRLKWVPVVGNDLASAPALFDMAAHLLNASLLSSQAAQPLLHQASSNTSSLDIASLTDMLMQAQPQLVQADTELKQAIAARASLDAGSLSPRLRAPLVDDLDPLLKLEDDGLSLATALPGVLGAGSDGPKTYLLLVENEDELRPTGGFITSVGNLVIHNGQVISLKFEPVDNNQEDWSRPYPAAPWQMQEYMNSRVLILRDANWYSDFPTSAMWAEYLYAFTHDHSVDGVIAFDQEFLVLLLKAMGPLEVEGAPYPITDENVVDYMHTAKIPPPDQAISVDWYRKEFINKIGAAMLRELSSGNQDWYGIARVLFRALDERHLLLELDDPVVSALSAERSWDGAVDPMDGDFLLVTDTNIGFNKTSRVVDVSLAYDIDLHDISAPESTLLVSHKNNADKGVPCLQWDSGEIEGEQWYPVDRCYWDYLRIYKQAGSSLLAATPHAIPGNWMLLGYPVPARVDKLDEELEDVNGYGTLLVVPGGDSVSTSFRFSLPATVQSTKDASGRLAYHLLVQKQAGTLAHPLLIRIHLPNGAVLDSSSLDAIEQNHDLLIKTDLRTDVELEVVFHLP